MYHSFCYKAFSSGILKEHIDNMNWDDTAILLHEMKIEQEDNLVQILEQEEKQGKH